MRSDELEVPVRAGDSPPWLPFRKPFDLNAWQLLMLIFTVANTLTLEQRVGLSDDPFSEDSFISPLMLARFAVLAVGLSIIFIQPGGRLLPVWLWVALCHFARGLPAVYVPDVNRGPSYYPVDASAMTRMRLKGDSAHVFQVDPPHWRFFRHTWLKESHWQRHVPYRVILPIEPQGSLEMMTDYERAGRWHALASGLKALQFPVQITGQSRAEDPEWLKERAMPPVGSAFAHMRATNGAWASERAQTLMQRRVMVTCSAPSESALIEHVRDVVNTLGEASLGVRELERNEQENIFDQVYGTRRFYPHPSDHYGIDDTEWVTICVRDFPRHTVVGWLMFIIGQLPVDFSLYAEPDDATWVKRTMEHFQGMCDLATADTDHKDAAHDLERIEGKLKRNEDSVKRTTLLLTMPKEFAPRVRNRLRKSGANFRDAKWEHQPGRIGTLPIGGVPRVGVTRPLDGESVAGCFPFGSSGLRSKGSLIGIARDAPEAVTLDLQDPALLASMVVILGTTGAGKTFLMQLLILRSGLPFVAIDMKMHLDEVRCGDFYRITKEAKGNYHVCRPGEPLPVPHPFAQTYNLAELSDDEIAEILPKIANQEWARAVDSLEDRIFAMDELYWLGKTSAGQAVVERVASQGRSVGFIGVFATQEINDAFNNDHLTKAITMSSVQIFMAQEASNVTHVVTKMNLGSAAEAELRKFVPRPGDTIASKTRSAIMRVGPRMCSVRIEASPEETRLFTTKPSDKRAMRAEAAERIAA